MQRRGRRSTPAQQGDGDLVRRRLGLGADPSIPDRRFGGTGADWARHFGHEDLVPMLDG